MVAVSLSTIFKPYLAAINGRKFLPKPPFILATNHLSPLDPALLLAALRLPIHFLTAGHLFKHRWGLMHVYSELVLRRLGQSIPTGSSSIEHSLEILSAGGIIGIFPEGDIHPALQQNRLHTGVAVIAQQAQVPVVPARIVGSEHIWMFTKIFAPWRIRKVHITIGEPIAAPVKPLNRQQATTFVTELMENIAALRP